MVERRMLGRADQFLLSPGVICMVAAPHRDRAVARPCVEHPRATTGVEERGGTEAVGRLAGQNDRLSLGARAVEEQSDHPVAGVLLPLHPDVKNATVRRSG